MDKSQIDYINTINHSTENDILIKNTGWEVVDLPEHLHDTHQIIHTLSGTIRIQIGEDVYFVPERHIAWISRNVAHTLSSNNRQISLQIINCSALHDPGEKCRVFNSSRFIGENLKFITRDNDIIHKNEHPELFNFATAFLNLLSASGERYRTPLAVLKMPDNTEIQQILGYINDNIEKEIRLEDIASHFGMSARTLSRIFRRANIHFTSYLNYQRITRAIELYADGDRTIQEIAFDVGYSSPNHFNRVFKDMMGTNPTTFFSRQKY